MDIDRTREFARDNHHAVLATRSARGVQQSPVLVAVDDEGCFVVSTREAAYKTKNLRRDPWAQLLLLGDGFFGDWYVVEGSAEVVSLPDALEGLVDYYRRAAGEHEDWDAYREEMGRQQRVLVRIRATRAGPDRQG